MDELRAGADREPDAAALLVLADPTTMNGRTWSCQSNHEPQPGQGAGALLMAWFEQQNG